MTIEHHDLHSEFPDMGDQIRSLKMKDRHFARLFDEYHEVDREVRKIEEAVEALVELPFDAEEFPFPPRVRIHS